MVWRDEFCLDLEDPIILPDLPVPTDVEDQATEEIGEEHVSNPTPEQEDANLRRKHGATCPTFYVVKRTFFSVASEVSQGLIQQWYKFF
jgi:hypothetical protein